MACPQPQLSYRPAIDRWLLCDECVDGELDSILRIDSRAVPTLINTLQGPSPDRVENIRRQLAADYARVRTAAAPDSPALSETDYIRLYLSNHRAAYQTRSAIALGRIGTDDAVAALQDAASDTTLRSDVLDVIRTSLIDSILVLGGVITAPVGSTVAARVQLIDGLSDPVPRGVRVRFSPDSGSGVVLPIDTITDSAATAETQWTLGPVPGQQRLRAAAGRATTFVTAMARSIPGSGLVLTPNSAVIQTGPAGDPVPVAPSVLVTDGAGNPVSGVTVMFAVVTGGGVTVASAVADSQGVANVASWTLGSALGPNGLRATAAGAANSVTFAATGRRRSPAIVSIAAGNDQSARAGTQVAIEPSVLVRDRLGRPVEGATVRFTVIRGGGSITGEEQITGATGRVTVGSWTLGSADPRGWNQLRASVRGAQGVVFNARAISFPDQF